MNSFCALEMMSSVDESMVRKRQGREGDTVAPARSRVTVDDIMNRNPEFLHSGVLMTALTAPLGIMLAFGDRTTLLVLCFGSIITYIFDILGSVEVRVFKQ